MVHKLAGLMNPEKTTLPGGFFLFKARLRRPEQDRQETCLLRCTRLLKLNKFCHFSYFSICTDKSFFLKISKKKNGKKKCLYMTI